MAVYANLHVCWSDDTICRTLKYLGGLLQYCYRKYRYLRKRQFESPSTIHSGTVVRNGGNMDRFQGSTVP